MLKNNENEETVDTMNLCEQLPEWNPMDAFDEVEDLEFRIFWAEINNPSAARRSFVFHPSFANVYWQLKEINPEWALAYLESVMIFGVDNIWKIPDYEKVKPFLINTIRIISKQCDKYLFYKSDNREKQKQINDAQRERDKEKASKGFFCYFDYLETAKEILTLDQYKEYLYGLTELCSYREYESTDTLINLCLTQVIPLVNATDLRYKRSLSNGRLGGRKKLFSDEDLIEAITKRGLSTQDELAKYFGCSIRTIARRVASENVKKHYDAHRKKNLRM